MTRARLRFLGAAVQTLQFMARYANGNSTMKEPRCNPARIKGARSARL